MGEERGLEMGCGSCCCCHWGIELLGKRSCLREVVKVCMCRMSCTVLVRLSIDASCCVYQVLLVIKILYHLFIYIC